MRSLFNGDGLPTELPRQGPNHMEIMCAEQTMYNKAKQLFILLQCKTGLQVDFYTAGQLR